MRHETAANILSKMGNPTRLKIVRLLIRAGNSGLAVGEIQSKLKIPGSTLTHHIANLESAGVIRKNRQQTTLLCNVDFGLLNKLVNYLADECCAGSNVESQKTK